MSNHPFTFDPILLEKPNRITPPYSWVGHIPFAFFLVKHHQPSKIVELGTTSGDSYFAFCQAVQEHQVTSKCFSINTGVLNPHTGSKEELAYEEARKYNEEHYKSFSSFIQKPADEALQDFDDASIDVLHIVNSYDYESTKHLFKSWLPKMSKRGVVLFHNTKETQNDFGVWAFWKELSGSYPSIDFPHSHGLGVSLFGRDLRKGKAPFFRHFKLQPHLVDLMDRMTQSYIPHGQDTNTTLSLAALFLPNQAGEFSADQKLTRPFTWETSSIDFELPQKLPSKTLRFAPAHAPCIIQLKQIELEMEDDHQFPLPLDNVSVLESVAHTQHTYFFEDEDPFFTIALKVPFDPKRITIHFSVLGLGKPAVDQLIEILQEKDNINHTLTQGTERLTQDKEQLIQEKAHLSKEQTKIQQNLKQLITQKEALEKDFANLNTKFQTLDKERTSLTDEKRNLEKAIKRSEGQLEKMKGQHENVASALQKGKIELEASLKKLEKGNELQSLLEEQIKQLKAQNKEISGSFDKIQTIYQQQVSTLEEAITHNRSELQLLQQRILKKEQEHLEEANRAYVLHERNLQLEKDISSLKNSFTMRIALGLTYPMRTINRLFGWGETAVKTLPAPQQKEQIPAFQFWVTQSKKVATILAVGPRTDAEIQIRYGEEDSKVSLKKLIFPQLEEQVFFLEHPITDPIETVSGDIKMLEETEPWGPEKVLTVDQPLISHCESAKVFRNNGLHITGWVVSMYPIMRVDLWSQDTQLEQVHLDQTRQDVQEDFPDYPTWQPNGFDAKIQLPEKVNTKKLVLRFVHASGDTHQVELKPIQTNRELVINS